MLAFMLLIDIWVSQIFAVRCAECKNRK